MYALHLQRLNEFLKLPPPLQQMLAKGGPPEFLQNMQTPCPTHTRKQKCPVTRPLTSRIRKVVAQRPA